MKFIKELTEYTDERDYKTLDSLEFLKSLKDNTIDKITYDWDLEIRKSRPDQTRLNDLCESLCSRLEQIDIDKDRISEMKDEFMSIIKGYSKAANRVPYIINTGTGYFPEQDYTPVLNGAGFGGDINEGGEGCNVIKKKKKMKHIKKFNEQIGMGVHPNDPENSNDYTWSESNPDLVGLKSKIADLIQSYVDIRDVPYSRQEGDKEMDPASVENAAEQIVEMLKNDG